MDQEARPPNMVERPSRSDRGCTSGAEPLIVHAALLAPDAGLS